MSRHRATGRPPVVLMYHSVSPYETDPYQITVRPERLDRQLDWLSRRGIRGVCLRQLLAAPPSQRAARLVGLSFDDGYADFAGYAVPILQRYGFTATVFPVAGQLGRDNAWDPDGTRKPLLTAAQLRQVAAAGMEVGSHGLRHLSLPAATDTELGTEIGESRRILREVSGQDVAGFCYPWGHVDERVVAQVRHAGYRYACAIARSPLPDPYALARNYIGDADGPVRLRAKWMCHRLGWEYSHPTVSPDGPRAQPARPGAL